MAIFGTFHHKPGNMWPQEYIADNGKIFYFKKRTCKQLVFIAAEALHHAKKEKNNTTAVVEHSVTAQTDADGNEFCAIEREGTLLHLNARNCRLGSSKLTWHKRRKIIDYIKG